MTYRFILLLVLLAAGPVLAQTAAQGGTSPQTPGARFAPAPVPNVGRPTMSPAARPGGTNSEYNAAGPEAGAPFSGPPTDPASGLAGKDTNLPQAGSGNAPETQPGTPHLGR